MSMIGRFSYQASPSKYGAFMIRKYSHKTFCFLPTSSWDESKKDKHVFCHATLDLQLICFVKL